MRVWIHVAAALAGCLAGLLGGCGGEAAPAEDERVRVVATLPPLAWPAEALLGERAEVTVLVPPGASPHGYEMSPSDAAALRRADLILMAGGADAWALDGLEAGDERVFSMQRDAHDPDHHPWLDIHAMARLVTKVAPFVERFGELELAERDPLAEVDPLRESTRRLAQESSVMVITSHDAWGKFFGGVGIEDVMAVRRGHSGEPAASTLVNVRERAAQADAVLVVLEPGEDAAWLEALAEEVGAAVVTLDPVGTRDWPGDMARRYESVEAALESLR